MNTKQLKDYHIITGLASLTAYRGPLTKLLMTDNSVWNYSAGSTATVDNVTVISSVMGGRWLLDTTAVATKAINAINSLFKAGTELYNQDDPDNEDYKYIQNDGVKVGNAAFSISGFISVKPSTNYTTNLIQFLSYFATDKITCVGGEMYNRASATTMTPPNAAFVRLTVPYNFKTAFRFQEGSSIDTSAITGNRIIPATSLPCTLTGKTILCMGTSIPELGGHIERAGVMIGATVINKALGSSSARKANADGTIAGLSWYAAMWNLSSTLAEKQALINNWDNIKGSLTFSPPTNLSQADKDFILNSSWERRLKPYLDGTYPMPSLFVFNHNFNDNFATDTDAQFTSIPADPFDRNTYIGAINYLVRQIITINPGARIAFISHYENQLYPRLGVADNTLAAYWQFPVLRLYEKTGWSQRVVPGTQALWGTGNYQGPRGTESTSQDMTMQRWNVHDGVHPSSNTTGKAQALLGRLCTYFFAEIL